MTLDSVGLEAAAKVLAFRDLAADPDWHGVYEEEWAAQPEEYREAWRESVREVLAPYLAAVVPVTPTTENPEALTLAFWECGHVEVDRGVEHPCDRDVCSATYESYATVVAGRAAATPDPPTCEDCGAELRYTVVHKCAAAASPDERPNREALVRAGMVALGERVPVLVPEGIRASVAAAVIDALPASPDERLREAAKGMLPFLEAASGDIFAVGQQFDCTERSRTQTRAAADAVDTAAACLRIALAAADRPQPPPDERLREAAGRLAKAVARVCGEGHPALAAWRVALAAATPDPPDESHAVKCAEARGYARGRFERDPAASPDPPDLPALDEGPLAYLLEDSAASPDERLREALAFYADKGNYTAQNPVGSGAHVWRDMGQRARAALAADRDSLAEKPETDT